MTSIETLMRDSNPILDPKTDFSAEEIQAFDLLVQSRSGSMDVQELTKPVEPEKKQRSGWLVAAGAFALVIVFVGAMMLLARPADELPPALTPPTTQATTPTTESSPPTTLAAVVSQDVLSSEQQLFVDGFVGAFNAGTYETYPGDYTEFLSYFDPEAEVVSTVLRSQDASWNYKIDDLRRLLAFQGAMGMQWALTECRIDLGSIACKIDIAADYYTDVPVESRFTLRTEDGLVTFFSMSEPFLVFNNAVVPFSDWVRESESASWREMFLPKNNDLALILNPESIALWIELLPEYKATLDG